MADSTLDITQSMDRPQKLLKIIDNGDNTYSIAVGDVTGLVNSTYDSLVITFTDANKTTISFITFYKDGDVVSVLTLTQDTLTDTWARS